MSRDRIYGLIGLAAKAGRIASGEFAALESIRKETALVCVIAEDASDNTKDRFVSACRGHGVPAFGYGTKDTLGRCIGKGERSALVIADEGFAEAAIRLLRDQEAEIYGK